MSESARSGIFYGWKIVFALFVMLSFSSGLGFYAHTIYLQALSEESGLSITLASGAVSLFFLCSGVSGVLIAPLLEKYDIRVIIAIGTLCASTALWMLGSVQTAGELFAVYCVFGFGFAASGLLPATTLIARWFESNRARALSIASTGLSLGGVILTPVCIILIEDRGLSLAAPWFAIMYLLGILPIVWVLKPDPADIGEKPDGLSVDINLSRTPPINFNSAIRNSYFWFLSFTYLLVMLAQVGAITHQYGLLSERISADQVRYAIVVLPAFSIIGRIAGAWVLDFVNTIKFTLSMICLQVISLGVISSAASFWLLAIGLAAFGLTMGNLLMLQPLLIAEIYGLKDYARIYSVSNLLTMFGVALGPVMMGALYAMTGGYQIPFITAAGLSVLACIIFALVIPPANTKDR